MKKMMAALLAAMLLLATGQSALAGVRKNDLVVEAVSVDEARFAFDGQVVLDADGLTIWLDSIEWNRFELDLNFRATNLSENKLIISFDSNTTVNGCQCPGNRSGEIESGQEDVSLGMAFSYQVLSPYGIMSMDDIFEFNPRFKVYVAAPGGEIIERRIYECARIKVRDGARISTEGKELLCDYEGVRVYLEGVEENYDGKYTQFSMLVENDCPQGDWVDVGFGTLCFNGSEMSGHERGYTRRGFIDKVYAGNQAIVTLSVENEYLESKDFARIERLEGTLAFNVQAYCESEKYFGETCESLAYVEVPFALDIA